MNEEGIPLGRDLQDFTAKPFRSVLPIMAYFNHNHLPPHLAEWSRKFSDLAWDVHDNIPHDAQVGDALRKLFEAKNDVVSTIAVN